MLTEMEANTKASQERMDTNLKDLKEEIKSGQAEMRSTIGAIKEKMEATIHSIWSERDETIQQCVKNIMVRIIHETQNLQKACIDMTTCHEVMESDIEKIQPDPLMIQSIAEHQEVPKEDAEVMPVGGLRKLCRDWNLAAGRCQKPRGRIQTSCESRRRLTVACRKVSCHARVAWCKRNVFRKLWSQGNWGSQSK
jgi:hypothetical protein